MITQYGVQTTKQENNGAQQKYNINHLNKVIFKAYLPVVI